jgi:hypothetical protein
MNLEQMREKLRDKYGLNLNPDQVLSKIFTPEQLKELENGGQVGVICKNQTVPKMLVDAHHADDVRRGKQDMANAGWRRVIGGGEWIAWDRFCLQQRRLLQAGATQGEAIKVERWYGDIKLASTIQQHVGILAEILIGQSLTGKAGRYTKLFLKAPKSIWKLLCLG